MTKTALDLALQRLLQLEPVPPPVPMSLVANVIESAAAFMDTLKSEGREQALQHRVDSVEKEMAPGSPFDESRKKFVGLFQGEEEMIELDLFPLPQNFGAFEKAFDLPYLAFPDNLHAFQDLSAKYKTSIPHLKAFKEYRSPPPPPWPWPGPDLPSLEDPKNAPGASSQPKEPIKYPDSPYWIGNVWIEQLYRLGLLAEKEDFWGCNLVRACRNARDPAVGHSRLMAELSAHLESCLSEALLAIQRTALELARGKINRLPANCSHSDDYRSIVWFGKNYEFSKMQAGCVRCLWEAYERGRPGVSKEDLLRASGSSGCEVKDIFKGAPAWKEKIILRTRQGIYCLSRA